MWKCPKCNESVEDELDVCWNCQTGYDGSSAQDYFSPPPSKDLQDLAARISSQSTADLKRIVNVDRAEYRADAIDIAKAELNKRGEPTDGGAPPPPRPPANARPKNESGSRRNERIHRVLDRYADAYRIARFMVTLGTLIKIVGGILGALIAFTLISFAAYVSSANLRGQQTDGAEAAIYVVGFLWGGVVFAVFFIAGVLVSAQGQILKANLDAAVHTSPFVNDDQKAQIMSLD